MLDQNRPLIFLSHPEESQNLNKLDQSTAIKNFMRTSVVCTMGGGEVREEVDLDRVHRSFLYDCARDIIQYNVMYIIRSMANYIVRNLKHTPSVLCSRQVNTEFQSRETCVLATLVQQTILVIWKFNQTDV